MKIREDFGVPQRSHEPAQQVRKQPLWRWMLQPAAVGFAMLLLIAGLGYLGREEWRRHSSESNAPELPVLFESKPAAAPEAAPPPAPSTLGGTGSGTSGRPRPLPEKKISSPPSQPAPAAEPFQAPIRPDERKSLRAGPSSRAESGVAPSAYLDDEKFSQLLQNAKRKIRNQEYVTALEDLLAAQRIRDSKEIQDLILLCRSHLRGDE